MDRENAHFNISEAIISAVEHMKCKKDLRLSDDPTDDSDPEILELKQRIRIRRKQKMVEKQKRLWASSILSDGINESMFFLLLFSIQQSNNIISVISRHLSILDLLQE